MKKSFLTLMMVGALSSAPLLAQVQTPAKDVKAEPKIPTQTPLMDAGGAGGRVRVVAKPNLFAAPTVTRALKIGVYYGPGSPASNSNMLTEAGKQLKDAEVTALKPEDFTNMDLSQFDVVVFPGGSGSGQAKALGEVGRENVRKFVKNGGGYLGICAGAYLATSCYDWSLGLYSAKTMQPWARGGGAVALELTGEGKGLLGKVNESFPVRYNNGPVIIPDEKKPDLPKYTVLAYFRDELARKPEQSGQMKDTPAIVSAQYGDGKVISISPHFEGTKNMENVLPTVLNWLARTPK